MLDALAGDVDPGDIQLLISVEGEAAATLTLASAEAVAPHLDGAGVAGVI